jgi:hypothetical protein
MVFVLIVMALLGGCQSVPIDATLDQPPLVEPIPARVGIYYSPEFVNHEYCFDASFTQKGEEGDCFISLGPPSIALFDQLFEAIFENTVHVQNKLFPTDDPDLDAVIEPSITLVSVAVPIRGPNVEITPHQFEVNYSFTLYDPKGYQIGSFSAYGSAQETWGDLSKLLFVYEQMFTLGSSHSSENILLGELAEKAMRKAAAEFLISFREDTEVQNWLKDLGSSAKSSGGE